MNWIAERLVEAWNREMKLQQSPPSDLSVSEILVEQLQEESLKTLGPPKIEILNSKLNEGVATYDGIDICGGRVAVIHFLCATIYSFLLY